MAGTRKDIQLIEYKETIKQLNMTVKSQNELILSLKDTIASNQEQMRIMTEQIEYLTRKLFGTSSEKSKTLKDSTACLTKLSRRHRRRMNLKRQNWFLLKSIQGKPKADSLTSSGVFRHAMKSYRFPKTRSSVPAVVHRCR